MQLALSLLASCSHASAVRMQEGLRRGKEVTTKNSPKPMNVFWGGQFFSWCSQIGNDPSTGRLNQIWLQAKYESNIF